MKFPNRRFATVATPAFVRPGIAIFNFVISRSRPGSTNQATRRNRGSKSRGQLGAGNHCRSVVSVATIAAAETEAIAASVGQHHRPRKRPLLEFVDPQSSFHDLHRGRDRAKRIGRELRRRPRPSGSSVGPDSTRCGSPSPRGCGDDGGPSSWGLKPASSDSDLTTYYGLVRILYFFTPPHGGIDQAADKTRHQHRANDTTVDITAEGRANPSSR